MIFEILSVFTLTSAQYQNSAPTQNYQVTSQIYSDDSLNKLAEDIHNLGRQAFGIKTKLTFDKSLLKQAEFSANYQKGNKLTHTKMPDLGENLAFWGISTGHLNVREALFQGLAEWLAELDDANDYQKHGKVIGHATQMLWEDSLRFACAVKQDYFGGLYSSYTSCVCI